MWLDHDIFSTRRRAAGSSNAAAKEMFDILGGPLFECGKRGELDRLAQAPARRLAPRAEVLRRRGSLRSNRLRFRLHGGAHVRLSRAGQGLPRVICGTRPLLAVLRAQVETGGYQFNGEEVGFLIMARKRAFAAGQARRSPLGSILAPHWPQGRQRSSRSRILGYMVPMAKSYTLRSRYRQVPST